MSGEFYQILNIISVFITAINMAMYWRIMERVTKIEEKTKGEINTMNTVNALMADTLKDLKKDVKDVTAKISELHTHLINNKS